MFFAALKKFQKVLPDPFRIKLTCYIFWFRWSRRSLVQAMCEKTFREEGNHYRNSWNWSQIRSRSSDCHWRVLSTNVGGRIANLRSIGSHFPQCRRTNSSQCKILWSASRRHWDCLWFRRWRLGQCSYWQALFGISVNVKGFWILLHATGMFQILNGFTKH